MAVRAKERVPYSTGSGGEHNSVVNSGVMKSKEFLKAFELAEETMPPRTVMHGQGSRNSKTVQISKQMRMYRQASKWLRNTGATWKAHLSLKNKG